jgi:transposase
MPKNVYTDEFKRDAVALVESGIPQKQVYQDLAISGQRCSPGCAILGSIPME